jgi:hypothetical protein
VQDDGDGHGPQHGLEERGVNAGNKGGTEDTENDVQQLETGNGSEIVKLMWSHREADELSDNDRQDDFE